MASNGRSNGISPAPPWQRALSRFFAKAWVEITVAVLVVISVCLTLTEFTYEVTAEDVSHNEFYRRISFFSDMLTLIFIVELTLRYLASSSKWRFWSTYWIEVIAVLPFYYFVPNARTLRLLRLIRLLRLFGVISRLYGHFPYLVRRSVVEYVFVCGLLLLTVVFGTAAMMHFEQRRRLSDQGQEQVDGSGKSSQTDDSADDDSANSADSESNAVAASSDGATADGETGDGAAPVFERWFWFNVYSLFAGEPIPEPPKTVGGKVVTVLVMFMGLTIFAMFTGTVSAFMVERLRSERKMFEWDDLHDHILICGWSSKAEIIVREFGASPNTREVLIAVIAEWDHDAPPAISSDLQKKVKFLNDDFTRVAALERAGVLRARTCIILSDTSHNRSEQDADARTILAALTVEKLNPSVYTCAELLNRSYGSHLQMGNVNDFVVSGEYGAYLLAQAAMNRGLMGVFSELLTYQHGNEFYRVQLPESWVGKRYLDLFVELKTSENAVLVGVYQSDGEMVINPEKRDFREGDQIVVIAEHEPKLG